VALKKQTTKYQNTQHGDKLHMRPNCMLDRVNINWFNIIQCYISQSYMHLFHISLALQVNDHHTTWHALIPYQSFTASKRPPSCIYISFSGAKLSWTSQPGTSQGVQDSSGELSRNIEVHVNLFFVCVMMCLLLPFYFTDSETPPS